MCKYFLTALLLVAPVFAQADGILIVADEWPQMEVLSKFLQEEGGYSVEMAEQDAMPQDLSGYHGVIEFVHGKLADTPAKQMMDYANAGGRLLVLHHGISSGKKATAGWYDFMGMELDRNQGAPKYYEWKHGVRISMANLQPTHYITSHKVKYGETIEYASSDQPSVPLTTSVLHFEDSEVFINHQFTDGREKSVLFGMHYEDAESGKVYMQDRGGWYKRAGAGWLFYFQPGHVVSDFEKTAYSQILMNCFTWAPGE